MESASVFSSLRLSWRDGAWLTVALMLHGSLLFIPFKQLPSEQGHPRILSLSLMAAPPPKAVTGKTPDSIQPQEDAKPETGAAQVSEATLPAVPEPAPAVTDPEESPEQVTTARLVDSASRLKWAFPKTVKQRQLGVHQRQEMPDNWRPSISMEDNLFNGMTVPRETEIVDQWVTADGSQNVVMTTTTGETLCGRRQAWDPMNPMLEQLMMFRSCGGGGKRTFKMPDRFNRHLVD